MPDPLDVELEQLTAVTCRRCGTPFPEHGDAGGPVRVRVGGWASPADAVALTCRGFLWVDPGAPPATYDAPPEPFVPDPFGSRDYGLNGDGTPDLGLAEG